MSAIRTPFIFAISYCSMALPLIAAPVLEYPRSYNPSSRTAQAITGPIIVSSDAVVFSNGARAELEFVESRDGDWSSSGKSIPAQIYRVTTSPGELLQGNYLCSEDDPVTFLAFTQAELFGNWSLGMAAFRGEGVPQASAEGTMCGTYNFDLPDGPIAGSEDTSSPQAVDAASSALADPDPGKWTVNRDSNPIDDTATVVARLVADEGRSQYGRAVTFTARCKSDKTEAYLNWNTYVGDDSSSVYEDWKYVTVRLGDKPSKEQRWGVSTDNEGTFAPDWAGTLLKEMVQEERMVVQMTPYGANPITAIFDIRGLEGPLREISEECGWSF